MAFPPGGWKLEPQAGIRLTELGRGRRARPERGGECHLCKKLFPDCKYRQGTGERLISTIFAGILLNIRCCRGPGSRRLGCSRRPRPRPSPGSRSAPRASRIGTKSRSAEARPLPVGVVGVEMGQQLAGVGGSAPGSGRTRWPSPCSPGAGGPGRADPLDQFHGLCRGHQEVSLLRAQRLQGQHDAGRSSTGRTARNTSAAYCIPCVARDARQELPLLRRAEHQDLARPGRRSTGPARPSTRPCGGGRSAIGAGHVEALGLGQEPVQPDHLQAAPLGQRSGPRPASAGVISVT